MHSDGEVNTPGEGARVPDDPDHVHIGILDADGSFRNKTVTGAKATKLAQAGGLFCDVLYSWNTAEVPQSPGAFIDRPTTIDPLSWRRYPFAGNDALCIADFAPPFGDRSPRNQARNMIERARQAGFSVHSAFEFEFTVLDETPESLRAREYRALSHLAAGNRTYSLLTQACHHDLLEAFEVVMGRLGIALDSVHTELGPGCFEAPLKHAEGIRGADDAALFKNFTKAFFLRRGLMAAFMAKLDPQRSGQSGHLHLSLRSLSDGAPAFADAAAQDGLSQSARSFIGGVVTLMPEMLALCSHTINAYKRLVPGAWAPTHSCWGIQNRTAALRVINDTPDTTRLEFRVPGADTNPYSALAMFLGAGLWGIEHAVTPPAPVDGDCYATRAAPGMRFPATLAEASARLGASGRARDLFGDSFVDTFVAMRGFEVADYDAHVSPWEIGRYVETA